MNAMEGMQQLVFYLSAGMSTGEARDRFLVMDCGVSLELLAEGIDSTPGAIRNRVRGANSALEMAVRTDYPLPNHPNWGFDDGRSLDDVLRDPTLSIKERNALLVEYHSVDDDE